VDKKKQWWLQISSGRGPAECCLAVNLLAKALIAEAAELGIAMALIQASAGPAPGTFHSMLFSMEGEAFATVQSWCGTVLWISTSPFRLKHKRKNWFVGVFLLMPPKTPAWSEKDIRVETMRASGPGGQHVNKTESAVRVTHLPTGIQVVAREERSQRQNRKLAEARLYSLLAARVADVQNAAEQECWQQHNELERGNPVRVYQGKNFQRVLA